MTRWEFITCDEYITATLECIITHKGPISVTRKDAAEFMINLRNELLHGDQGSGCFNSDCRICFPGKINTIAERTKMVESFQKKLENGRGRR